MTKPMIQRKDEWLTTLIELNQGGKLSDAALLAALKFSNEMWNVNPPALVGNTESIMSQVHMTKAVYYRHIRELAATGALIRENSHRIAPVMPEPPASSPKNDSMSSW